MHKNVHAHRVLSSMVAHCLRAWIFIQSFRSQSHTVTKVPADILHNVPEESQVEVFPVIILDQIAVSYISKHEPLWLQTVRGGINI